MRRLLTTLTFILAAILGWTGLASADPAPGGNNSGYVCAPGQTSANPPPCPGK